MMRWRSIQATLTAVALLLASGAGSRAQSDAPAAAEAPAAKAPAAAKALADTTIDRLPTGSLAHSAPGEPAGAFMLAPDDGDVAAKTLEPVAKKGDKTDRSLDPEPDGVSVPPRAPSADPLDALTAPDAKRADKPADAQPSDAKPGDAKPSDAKPGDSKASDAKPDARPSTTGAAQPSADAPAKAEQATEALPARNGAIKAALDKRDGAPLKGAAITERRKERKAIAFLYASHGFAPMWSTDGAPAAAVASILERLDHAGDDALSLPRVPTALVSTGTPETIAESDIAMTEAVVAYARQATGARVDPSAIGPLIGVKRALADPAEVIDALAVAGATAGDTLRALNPTEPRYVALRDKLVALRAAHRGQAAAPQGAIPAGPTLRLDMRDKRVPLLRARFALGPAVDGDDLRYDSDVADAVAAFQKTNGLQASGALTKRTVAVLSGGSAAGGSTKKLEATIAANMEMWRWMPRELGTDRIEVNVPDFAVTVFHDGQPVSQNRVVVGKIDTPTPLFSNTMKYLIVNPYWNVPQSIIRNELLPKGGGSLSYLSGRGYSVSSAGGMPVVKQLPGDKNALGRIKFLFPNDYSVYLHDTPSKALFAASKRAFSHGCVRVDKPFAFAESVLNDTPDAPRKAWSQGRLESMIGEKERYVNLPAPLPIHIEYFTASIDGPEAKLKLRDDVYGYANAVAGALDLESETRPIAGRVKPAPLPVVADRAERRHRPVTVAAVPSPAPPENRGFWSIFDPR